MGKPVGFSKPSMLSGSTASKPLRAHMAKRARMIGSSTDSRRTSSHLSPGQPLPLPRTAAGNRPESGRHRSQVPTST